MVAKMCLRSLRLLTTVVVAACRITTTGLKLLKYRAAKVVAGQLIVCVCTEFYSISIKLSGQDFKIDLVATKAISKIFTVFLCDRCCKVWLLFTGLLCRSWSNVFEKQPLKHFGLFLHDGIFNPHF